jgi:hypothetical protein
MVDFAEAARRAAAAQRQRIRDALAGVEPTAAEQAWLNSVAWYGGADELVGIIAKVRAAGAGG